MSYNARSWSNPINLDANNLNRLEQGIKNSHDTLEILNEEVSNLQLRYKNTASKINLLVKDSPNILETLNNIQSTIKNNDVNSILSSMDSFLMKSKQSLTDNELIQVYSNLKLNTFLRLDSIKVNGENVVEGSTVNIELPKVDEHLDINSNNAISNRAVAEALDKLKTLKPSGSNTNTNINTNISGLADWALQPNKPQYYFSEILGKPDLITKTEAHKYTDKIFSALVNGAPETLDTLKEISDWIATDEYGTTALINRVSSIEQNYLPLTGGTLTGAINLNGSYPQIKTNQTDFVIQSKNGSQFVFNDNEFRPALDFANKLSIGRSDRKFKDGYFSGTVYATGGFDGNAASATKSTQDSSGNVIVDTYVKKTSVNSSNSTKPFDKIPFINSAGVMEVGTYVDFHSDNTTGNDYSTRLYANGENKNAVKLPSGSGTLALTTDNVASATKATQDGDGKVIKDTYTKLDGSNYHAKLTEPSGNGNVAGWRHIASYTVGKWAYAHLELSIRSRHSGVGLLTIGICDTNGGIDTVNGSIRFYGSTDSTMYTNAWKMIYNTTTGTTKVYWRFSDYNTCEVKVLGLTGFTCHWNNGEWLTAEPIAGENEVEYLPVIYDKEYLPLTGGTLTNTLTVNAPSGKSMFYRANNDTPLIIKGGTTGSFIEYQDSTGQLGYLGVSTDKKPTFYQGGSHEIALKKDVLPLIGGALTGSLTLSNGGTLKSTADLILTSETSIIRFGTPSNANAMAVLAGGSYNFFRPGTTNILDLGTSAQKWKDGHFAGTVNAGSLSVLSPYPQIKGAGTNVCISTNGAWDGTGGEFVFEAGGLRPSGNRNNKQSLYGWQNGTFGGTVNSKDIHITGALYFD